MAQITEYVLDTSALFTLRNDEPGAATVQEILEKSLANKRGAWACFITLTEYFYIIYQKEGKEEANSAFLQLKTLPIEWIKADEELLLIAGEYKALYSISLADSLVAASAFIKKAVLLHKDPEFEALKDRIKLKNLPYK